MAMGLGFLGRGKVTHAIHIGIIHILGAAIGGAIIGGLLGWVGALLSLALWRPWIITTIAIFAAWHSLSRRPQRLGRQCQVPRAWAQTMPVKKCYLLWGILLGSGIATPIPYSALLVVFGTQLTVGVVLGCLSGALFGATREALALLPLIWKRDKTDPEKIMELLPALAPIVQRFNVIWIFAGSLLLLLTQSLW